ncbi:MAG: FGGY-family carbohydrate kinase [Acidimicrobiales bacterium]
MPTPWWRKSGPRRGPRRAGACRCRASRSPSWLGSDATSPRSSAGSPGCCCPTTGSRHGSPAGSPPTGATRPAPVGGRRAKAATATICSPSSTRVGRGRARCPRCSGPPRPPAPGTACSSRRAPATTWPRRWGWACARATLALSLGTSGTAFCVSDRPSHDPTGTVAGFADATGRFLPLVCTLNATKVTDAVARLLGVDAAGLDALALDAPAGANGLELLPYLDGERTPNLPDATGTLTGIRSDVSRQDLARAAVEGVVRNLLAGAALLSGADEPGDDARVWLIGGGSHSPAYRSVVVAMTGRPISVPGTDELVARGAALQAAAVLTGRTPAEVSEAWGHDDGAVTVR